MSAQIAGVPVPARDPRRTAITNVTVVPMDRDGHLPARTVVIENGRIESIRPAGSSTDAAVTIDGTGQYLMPGIADMHVHWWDVTEFPLYLANGVTMVRNMWGAPMHLALRRKIADGSFPGPFLATTSPIVDGPGPTGRTIWPNSIMVADPKDAAPAVQRIAARGYDQLKVYSWLSPDAHAALCRAAADAGLLVTGHCPDLLTFEQAIANGQRCFEHLTGLNYGHFQPGVTLPDPRDRANRQAIAKLTIEKLDLEAVRRLAADMATSGVWNCPTTTVWQQMSQKREAALADPNLRFIPASTRTSWDPANDFRFRGIPVTSDEYLETRRRLIQRYLELVMILHEAGSPLLIGTDTPNPYVVPGFSVHQELRNFVAAGIRPFEALRGATADAARFLGQAGEWGSVEAGKRADLLLMRADPLADVGALRDLSAVFVNGYHLTRADLDAALTHRAESLERSTSFSTALDPSAQDSTVVREGRITELLAGTEAGQFSFRHLSLANGETQVDERYANRQDRLTSQLRSTTLRLRADGSLRSGRQTLSTYLGDQTIDVHEDDGGVLVRIEDVDGFRTDARVAGAVIPGDRLSATALAIVAARSDAPVTLSALTIDQADAHAIPISIARGDSDADRVLSIDRGSELATQTYTITPDGGLLKVSELSFRGLRELVPDQAGSSKTGG